MSGIRAPRESYRDRFYNLRDDNRAQLARNINYKNEQ